ncbi:foldase protein PrsA [Paenibacillus taihuensis]|uniref:peptidylprolyl isomerase n=1 Tax=Paenibacillus taihuensis TaxID=1156355 RepID=A0A3D9Q1D9_9BACL|nr:peptidylprolyl isomerase [Paenibacillus taihuensis]REE56402.1 foldase protein PrsA [Paenibacillus taihuensis]
MLKKDRVLRSIVLLQAVCMIIMAILVVFRVLLPPKAAPQTDIDGLQQQGNTPPSAEEPIAATVGSERITEKQLNEQLRLQYGDQLLRTLMVRAATRLEADAYGLQVTEEEIDDELSIMMAGYESEQQYYDAMKEQLGLTREGVHDDAKYRLLLDKVAVRSVDVTDAEIDAYIADNKEQYSARTQLHLAWIVVPDRKTADEVLDKLSDGEDFALMARTYSIDSDTSENGGDLGYIDADDPFADQAMLEAAGGLSVGGVTGPITVDLGQAIIQLLEKKTEKEMSNSRQRDQARRDIALSKLNGLRSFEDQLLQKYDAKTVQP